MAARRLRDVGRRRAQRHGVTGRGEGDARPDNVGERHTSVDEAIAIDTEKQPLSAHVDAHLDTHPDHLAAQRAARNRPNDLPRVAHARGRVHATVVRRKCPDTLLLLAQGPGGRRRVGIRNAQVHPIPIAAGRVMNFVDKSMATGGKQRCTHDRARAVTLVCCKRALFIDGQDWQLLLADSLHWVDKDVWRLFSLDMAR